MMRRLAGITACLLALASCANHGKRTKDAHDLEIIERSRHVDRRMLDSPDATSAYKIDPQQRFRMPRLLEAPLPQLPTDSPRTALPPTTVCVQVILSDQGAVQRVDPLDDRDECHAGLAAANSDLMQAVRERLLEWNFTPAAICSWPEDRQAPLFGGCEGAAQIQSVPVSLMYAFTFEIREGKTVIRQGQRIP
jgi:hypothetical protein